MSSVPLAPQRVGSALSLRHDFPILDRTVHGKRLVYLDSAATSQKPASVLAAVHNYYAQSNANVHRGVYLLAEEATEMYENARAMVGEFIGAQCAEEIVFTRNATEAINLVAATWGHTHVDEGDAVAISALEHHSNFVPWQSLAREKGAHLAIIGLTEDGRLSLDSLDEALATHRVKLVAIAGVSNVLGVINPIAEVVGRAHAAGALVLVDAAQMVPHMPIFVGSLGADFVAFTGHKMLGPMGIGVLWARRELLEEMPPFLFGGEMIRRVTEVESTWNDVPWKFEAGTPDVAGAVGLAAAIDYLAEIGMDEVRAHELYLVTYALAALGEIDDVAILGPTNPNDRSGVVSFNVGDIHPHDLASLLDSQRGVAVRAGHHCAQPLHERLGLVASARASFYLYNTRDDIDELCAGIEIAGRIMNGDTVAAT